MMVLLVVLQLLLQPHRLALQIFSAVSRQILPRLLKTKTLPRLLLRQHLLAARLQLPPMLPKEMLASLYVNAMAVFNRRLLAYEAAEAGSLAIAPGHCTLCVRCARADGKPCPRPEQIRLSLDAFSLEIARMASELFHFEIQWFNDRPPAYLTLIGGLLSMRPQISAPAKERVSAGLEEAVDVPMGG